METAETGGSVTTSPIPKEENIENYASHRPKWVNSCTYTTVLRII